MDISIGIVTSRTVAVNRDGYGAARILQTMITDPRDVQSVQLVSQTGEESNPPNGSLVAVIGESEGMKICVATTDGMLPDLDVGGKRIYSTDESGTIRMADIRLDPDGKITVTGPASSFTMNVDGTIVFNGVSTYHDHRVMTPKGMVTEDGGFAIKVVNATGAPSVRGEIVTPVAGGVGKILINVPNPIGVWLEDGVANGAEGWVVQSGRAFVKFVNTPVPGYLARGFVSGESGTYVSGQAWAEPFPTSPFATDKHFYEIGHIFDSEGYCNLHMN